MRKAIVLKINLISLREKCMVSMATHNAFLKKGDVPTKSFISKLLRIPD